jgi:integrase
MTRGNTGSKLHLLTVREVQTASEGDHSDGGGLLLRVRGNSCSWVLRFTSPTGRRREMGLGVERRSNSAETGASLTAVRKLAYDAREMLTRGLDPITQREQGRAEKRRLEELAGVTKQQQRLTLARAARDYHERVIEPRLSGKHGAQWISSLENHVPPEIWHAPVATITAPELLRALSGIRSLEKQSQRVPETLRRIRQRLDAVFEDVIFHGHCSANPAAAIRRKMRESLPRRQAGAFAALDFRQAPSFTVTLRQAPGTAARCLEFAMLTAARTTEAITAKWSEFDMAEATWKVPATKMKAGEMHVVYLSERALQLLRGQIDADVNYVFPSPGHPGRHLSNMALLATLDRLGFRGVTTVHGLCRATFSTWANETGAARPDVIEACLAHKEQDRVKAAYNRAKFAEERRLLLKEWADYLQSEKPVLRLCQS